MTDLESIVREQQLRLDSLEKQLFQAVSKQHRTGFKPADMGPFAKLESTVRLLNEDFQRFRGTDTRQLTESLCLGFQTKFRKEMEEILATKASDEQLQRFDQDVKRIESFSRDVQTGFFAVRNKLESTDKDLTDRFSEARWQVMRDKLRATAHEDLEGLVKEFRTNLSAKEFAIQEQVQGLQTLANNLDREVRVQYGPEMLAKHLYTLEQSLQASQNKWLEDQEAIIQGRLKVIEEQSHITKSLVLDATSLVKQELNASALQQRYKTYDDKLQEYQGLTGRLQDQITNLEKQIQRQVAVGQERQSDLFEQVQTVQSELKPLQDSIRSIQTQVQDKLQTWLADRQGWLQASVSSTEEHFDSYEIVREV